MVSRDSAVDKRNFHGRFLPSGGSPPILSSRVEVLSFSSAAFFSSPVAVIDSSIGTSSEVFPRGAEISFDVGRSWLDPWSLSP